MTAPATSKSTRVIINADDFGYNEDINNAIVKSFETGIISSTTILVNTPGFLDAVEKINSNLLLKDKVGLHINLVEGFPLSDPIRRQKRFCDESGTFAYKRNQAVFSLNSEEKKAIELEIKAQIDKALQHGIRISHVDSHHGTHTEWGNSRIILKVLKDYQIKKIRIARNMGLKRGPLRELYKFAFNSYLKFRRFKGVDWFGGLEDFIYTSGSKSFDKKSIEIMVHPVVAENGIIRDLDYSDIKNGLRPVLENFQITGYCEI